MNKHALVDLGSNTIRLSVYEELPGGKFRQLFSEKQTVGLANYVEKGSLTEAGMKRATEAIQEFRHLLQIFGMDRMNIFATASLRNINNTEAAVAYIERETGFRPDVISGEEEGALSYYGALAAAKLDDGVLFDIGGGSTELVTFANNHVILGTSLAIGSLNLFRQHVSGIWPKRREIQQLEMHIDDTLSTVIRPKGAVPRLYGVGGTARALLLLEQAMGNVKKDERVITIEQLDELTNILRRRSETARNLVLRHCPSRVHTIIPGALLVNSVCHAFRCDSLYISSYGVREGYLCQKLLKPSI